jgi:hypothetical protein
LKGGDKPRRGRERSGKRDFRKRRRKKREVEMGIKT